MECVTSPPHHAPSPLMLLKVNNHAANLWKDYYLDHHDRFDVLVSRLAEQPKTVKKPLVPSKPPSRAKEEGSSPQVARKRHLSPPPPPPRQVTQKKGRSSAPSQTSRQKRAPSKTATTTTSSLARPPKRPRATLNSLSAPLPSNDVPNLMPPQVDIPLPEPPSRSPTPPTIVQVGTNGNRYTKEDRDYFIKFLMWRLKQEPSLTKKELCELLHEKVNNVHVRLHDQHSLIKQTRYPTIVPRPGLHIGINVTTSPTRSLPRTTATPRTMRRTTKTSRMRKRRWKSKRK